MSREKELIKNTFVLGAGKILPKFISVITLPILTARLTKAEMGTFDLISTTVMLLLPIATLQIQSAAFRFLIDHRGDKKESAVIISSIMAVTLPISVLVSFLIFVFFPAATVSVRAMIAAYFLLDNLYLTLGQVIRGLGLNREFSAAAVLLSVINGVGIVLLVRIADTGIRGALLSLLAANLAGLVYFAVRSPVLSYLDPGLVSTGRICEMVSYSWPMVPNNLSTWVLNLSDRLVITAFLGIEANAVYSVANKIPNLLSIAQSVFVMAWQENASIAVSDRDARDYYSRMLDRTYTFIFSCTAFLISMTPLLFRFLIRGDYKDAYNQMPILVLGMFFFTMSSFFGGIYVAYKKTFSVGISTTAAAALNLIIDLCLVRRIGITAGSLSSLAAYAALYLYRIIDVQRFQRVDVNIPRQILQLAVILVMLAVCFMQKPLLNLANLITGGVVFIWCNRDFIRMALERVRKRL